MPAQDATDVLVLVCDGCGRTRRDQGWSLLWFRAGRDGWTGADRAVGPHHCPTCTAAQARS